MGLMAQEIQLVVISGIIGAILGGLLRPPLERFSNYIVDEIIIWKSTNTLSDEELSYRSRELYRQLHGFVADREQQVHKQTFPRSPESNQQTNDIDAMDSLSASRQTVKKYHEMYGGDVQTLLNEYNKRGLDTERLEDHHPRPGNHIGVAVVANELLRLSEKIDES